MAANFSISSDSESDPSEEVEEGDNLQSRNTQDRQNLGPQRHTLTLPELRMSGRNPQRSVGEGGIKGDGWFGAENCSQEMYRHGYPSYCCLSMHTEIPFRGNKSVCMLTTWSSIYCSYQQQRLLMWKLLEIIFIYLEKSTILIVYFDVFKLTPPMI